MLRVLSTARSQVRASGYVTSDSLTVLSVYRCDNIVHSIVWLVCLAEIYVVSFFFAFSSCFPKMFLIWGNSLAFCV